MNRPWLTLPATLVLAAAMSGCSPQAIQAVNTALAAVSAAQVNAARPVAQPSPKASPKPKASAAPADDEADLAEDADATADADDADADQPKPRPVKPRQPVVDTDDDEADAGEGEADGEADGEEDGEADGVTDGDDAAEDDCATGFAEADTNRDRDVSLGEYLAHESDADAQDQELEREAFTEAFETLDENADGVLTDDEYCPS